MTLQVPEHRSALSANAAKVDTALDQRTKGMPGGIFPLRLSEVGERGWNVLREDLPLPLAVLRESAMEHNSRWMKSFLVSTGASIAPHGKTTMSPQLFRRQLKDGAWAITVATVQQLQVCRHYGFDRILMANQVVGPQAARYVVEELRRDPDFDFYCFVDSLEGVRLLADAARANPPGRPVQVLLEVGFQGGRTGVRTTAAGLEVAAAVNQAQPFLALRGVSGFEGLIPGDSPGETEHRVETYLDFVVAVAEAMKQHDRYAEGTVILSAGGSAFYDLVARRCADARVGNDRMLLIRSGCYLTHDSSLYAEQFQHALARSPELLLLGDGPRPALELWAYVQSRPEENRAILGFGKRDCSFDAGMPRPLAWYRPSAGGEPDALDPAHRIVDLNDQHAFLDMPSGSPLEFGDMVMLGISHPCTTFDKWQTLLVVDDAYDVVGAVQTFF